MKIRLIFCRTQRIRCAVVWLLFGVVALTWQFAAQGQKVYPRYEIVPKSRLEISPGSATLSVGQPMSFKITLRDATNKPLPVSSDTAVQLTLTTMAKLEDAKKQLNEMSARLLGSMPKPVPLKPLDQQSLTLVAGQSVVRLEGLLPQGRSEATVKLTAQAAGQVRLYAECSRCSPGEAVLAVLIPMRKPIILPIPKKKSLFSNHLLPPPLPLRLQPVFWQPAPPSSPPSLEVATAPSIKLRLIAPTVPPTLERGEWVALFRAELLSAPHQNWPPPRDLNVIFKVLQGAAQFDPVSLMMKAGDSISEPVKLRSKLGGPMELAVTPAQTAGLLIEPDTLSYQFQGGARATQLSLQPSGSTALANNLDEIVVEVMATTIGDDGQTYLMRPADEAMPERRVSFSTEPSFGVRFENGQNQITIKENEDSGRIKLYSSLPVSQIRVKAQAANGLRAVINGELKQGELLAFKLPTAALICALLGGLLWSLWLKLRAGASSSLSWAQSLFRGLVGGFAFYVVVFFGALAVGYATTTSPVVSIAKLPTASWLAASVLGLIGGKASDWLFGRPDGRPTLPNPAASSSGSSGSSGSASDSGASAP